MKASQILGAISSLLVISSIYLVGMHSANEVKGAFLQETDGQTIYGFTTCNITKCKYECPAGDSVCLAAANNYYGCYATNDKCKAYEAYYVKAQAYDPLPADWYACQAQCKPADMGNFANRYNCIQGCGKGN